MRNMKFNIAVVQFEAKQFSPRENLKKAEKFIKKAVAEKAKIIVFPENFITGPILGKIEFVDFNGKYKRFFQDLARKHKIDIVAGSVIEGDKNGVYNTTYYITNNGRIRSRYRKIYLWHSERGYITPGHKISVFNTKYGKIGLIICWDAFFPEIFREMIKKGVNVIFCPSYWYFGYSENGMKNYIDSGLKLVDSLCISRAFENEIIFVYCNAAGKFQAAKSKDILIGHSQITAPFKGVIKKLDHNKEEMFVQMVDTSILRDAEAVYKLKGDLKKKQVY